MDYLTCLPRELCLCIADFFSFDDALRTFYPVSKRLWSFHDITKDRFRATMKLFMQALITEPDRDLLQFCRNLGLIHLIPLFKHLPARILADPFQAALEGLTWTAIWASAPEKQISLYSETLSNFQTTIIHALRFDWKNTQAISFWKDGDWLVINTFLFTLQPREDRLNAMILNRIQRDMEVLPHFRPILEPFLNKKIVQILT